MRPAARLASAAALAALLSASLGAAEKSEPSPAPKPPEGFTALFNGKDLTGWQGNIDMKDRAKMPREKQPEFVAARTKTALEHWSVVGGVIHCDGKGGVSLQTTKDYANFELYVDWKIAKNGDSGLYLRGQPQVQIWDSENTKGAVGEDKNSGSGGLWNNPAGDKAKKPLKKADKPVGEWNTFHIVMVGDEVTIKLNGELVVDHGKLPNYFEKGKPLPESGPVELQFHGDPLWFRNIYIKELK